MKKKTQVTSTFVGLELIDADMPRSFHGHVILGDNAPILAYQIGTHETRVLVDVRSKVPSSKMKEHLLSRADDMPESLRPSYIKAVESADRYPSMPNSFLPPTTNTMPGFVVLGDALNMRHPLTGGGMTVAFNDVLLLRDLLSPEQVPDLLDTQEVLQTMSSFHWKRKATGGGSSVINILSMALYSLFAADDAQLRALQRGCFEYFQLGGECVAGPCGLLAGYVLYISSPFISANAKSAIAASFGNPWCWYTTFLQWLCMPLASCSGSVHLYCGQLVSSTQSKYSGRPVLSFFHTSGASYVHKFF